MSARPAVTLCQIPCANTGAALGSKRGVTEGRAGSGIWWFVRRQQPQEQREPAATQLLRSSVILNDMRIQASLFSWILWHESKLDSRSLNVGLQPQDQFVEENSL